MGDASRFFSFIEFELDGPMPYDCRSAYTELACEILDPTRAHFGMAAKITSGYRPPAANTAAHGQPDSQHMATADHAAADFEFEEAHGDMRIVFDWMRQNPNLPFNQLILEHTNHGTTIIHVSWNRLKPGLRSCKEGHTNNASPYVDVECVPYNPSGPSMDVELATQ